MRRIRICNGFYGANSADELKEYHLTTVTYGTTSAPYLEIHITLLQLEPTMRSNDFLRAVRENMYVDDILAGRDILQDALKTRKQTEGLVLSAFL